MEPKGVTLRVWTSKGRGDRLVPENENQQLENLPQADFGREHENISLVGKEKVNN